MTTYDETLRAKVQAARLELIEALNRAGLTDAATKFGQIDKYLPGRPLSTVILHDLPRVGAAIDAQRAQLGDVRRAAERAGADVYRETCAGLISLTARTEIAAHRLSDLRHIVATFIDAAIEPPRK